MFYLSAADKKNLQDLQEKYLDKEIENYDPNSEENKVIKLTPTYKDILKEEKDIETKILNYNNQYNLKQINNSNIKDLENFLYKHNQTIKELIKIFNTLNDEVSTKLNPSYIFHALKIYDNIFTKNRRERVRDDEFMNKLEKIYIEIRKIDKNSYNLDYYFGYGSREFYKAEFYKSDFNMLGSSVMPIIFRHFENVYQRIADFNNIYLKNRLNEINNYNNSTAVDLITTFAIYKNVDQNQKINTFKDICNEIIISINNIRNIISKDIDPQEIVNNDNLNKTQNELIINDFDFKIHPNLHKLKDLLKKNPYLFKLFREEKYEVIANFILNDERLLYILNSKSFEHNRIRIFNILFLYLFVSEPKSVISALLCHFLLKPLTTSDLSFIESNIYTILNKFKSKDCINKIYSLIDNVKNLNRLSRKLDFEGIFDSYSRHIILNNIEINSIDNYKDKIKTVIDNFINNNGISNQILQQTVFSDEKLLSNLYKILNKNKENLILYSNKYPTILKICIIYYMCNKDMNYLQKHLNNISSISNDDYVLYENLKGNESFKILLENILKYKNSLPESKIISILNKVEDYSIAIHVSSVEKGDKDKLIKYLISTNINVNSEITKNFLYFNSSKLNPFLYLDESEIKSRLDLVKYDFNEFKKSIDKYTNMFDNNEIISNNDQEFLKIYKFCQIINGLNDYKSFKPLQKPKIKNLSFLNMAFPEDNIIFKVLGDNDIEYFTVGADTHCCQIIGGAGNDAVVDSFINPYASVLILQTNTGKVLAQSYFHYVPKDNGFILDNVEINANNVGKLGIKLYKEYADLTKYYGALADKVISGGFKYLKCGLDYNKLYPAEFRKVKKLTKQKDPRHFEYEDFYTDFDPNEYLLLNEKPNKDEEEYYNKIKQQNDELRKNRIKMRQRQSENEWLERQPPKFRENFEFHRKIRDQKEENKEYMKENKNNNNLTYNLKDKLVNKYSK